MIRSSGVTESLNSVDSDPSDSNDETEGHLCSDADDNADYETEDYYDVDDNVDDNGSNYETDLEKYIEDEMEEESDKLSPKDKHISDFYNDSVQSIGQGKEVKGISFKQLTCQEGSNIAQSIPLKSSTQRKTFMGPKSAKERWVRRMKANQQVTMGDDEHDAHLDTDLSNLVDKIALTIPEKEFNDSGDEGVERSASVAFILGLDHMQGSDVSVPSPSDMGGKGNVEGGDLDTESRNRSECTGGNVDSNSLEQPPKKASADIDSETLERSEGVSVERDSKVRETGNVAEDYLHLDRETVQRSESTGDIVDLEQPPKESKVSKNTDSDNVERSEAIVGSGSNVGEQVNVEAGDLDHIDDIDSENVESSEVSGLVDLEQPPKESKVSKNTDSDNVERSEAFVGSRSNVGEQVNVEAGDLDRIHDIDSENVESSEVSGGSRSTIVESISQELPRNQWKLIDYTESESDLSDEGTGGSVFRKTNISACGRGVQSPTSGLQTLNTDLNEIVIAGGPSYVRGQTLYLEDDDVNSESFNRSDSTFGIIDTSSQVAIAPEVSNLSVGSRSFPPTDVSTASRSEISQQDTAAEVRIFSDRYMSVQTSRIEVSTLSRCSTSLTDTDLSTATQCSTSLTDTEVCTASRSEISQQETADEVRIFSDRYMSVQTSQIEVSTLSRCSTSLTDTEVSTASRSEILHVRKIREREISVMESSSKKLANWTEGAMSAPVDRHDSAVADQIIASVTSPVRDTSGVNNSRETNMETSSKKLANWTEGAMSAPVDRYDSDVVDQILASVTSPVRDTKWPKSNFKFKKDKGKTKQHGPKWIHSSVDSDSELQTLCRLGPKFAVGIDALFYLADETTYLPEVKCANDPSYPSLVVVLSIVPPVELFHAKKEQYEKIYRATIQVEIEYTEELFEIDTSGIPIEQALETREIQDKCFNFKYDVTGVRVAKRKHQQTMDRYLLKPYEWKPKVNITFECEPMIAYKHSQISLASKLSVSRNQPIRRPAIGGVSRGVKRPFSGDHSDRISKRSCRYSGKLVTPDVSIASRLSSGRTASSNKYLLMTPLLRWQMQRVQIQLKTAKENLILKKKEAQIERMNYLKRLFTFPFKSKPICTKDKEKRSAY